MKNSTWDLGTHLFLNFFFIDFLLEEKIFLTNHHNNEVSPEILFGKILAEKEKIAQHLYLCACSAPYQWTAMEE